MKKIICLISFAIIALTSCKEQVDLAPIPQIQAGQVKADWTADGLYSSKVYGDYTVYNNVWGSNPGYQSIWANNGSNWGIWSNHPNTNGIKSYPHSVRKVNKSLSSLGSCTSSFNVTLPSSGSWGADYDIWTANNQHEIMLWMNYRGNVGPIASGYDATGKAIAEFTNVSVGGHTWNVYKGSNGSNAVYSFLRTSNTTSGTVDVKAIMNYIKGKGWFNNPTLDRVEFGFEVTSTSGGLNHQVNSYSVSYN